MKEVTDLKGTAPEPPGEKGKIGDEDAAAAVDSRHLIPYTFLFYHVQQVVPVVAEEEDRLVVVTVYTFYFQETERR